MSLMAMFGWNPENLTTWHTCGEQYEKYNLKRSPEILSYVSPSLCNFFLVAKWPHQVAVQLVGTTTIGLIVHRQLRYGRNRMVDNHKCFVGGKEYLINWSPPLPTPMTPLFSFNDCSLKWPPFKKTVKCKDYRAKSNTTLYLPPTLTIKKK
jgi:hypothetical protein